MKAKSFFTRALSLALAAVLAFSPVMFGGRTRAYAADGAVLALGQQSTRPGGTVHYDAKLKNAPAIKSYGVSEITVGCSGSTISNVTLNDNGATLSFWDNEKMNGVSAYGQLTDINGIIVSFDVAVASDAVPGEYAVTLVFQPRDENGNDMAIDVEAGKLTVLDAYGITYNANGGTGAPAAQTKIQGTDLTLSSQKPSKKYTITYNANGGSVSAASKQVSCTFTAWNTVKNGTGNAYQAGGVYTADSPAALYAQYTNPTAGTLAVPSRDGFAFDGWFTAASGGTKISSSTKVSGNMTVYAHWTELDLTPPTGTLSATNDLADRQTVTLTLSDNKGVAGYYWGASAVYSDNAFNTSGAGTVRFAVTEPGTYYLVVRDTSDNLSEPVSITFYKTDLNGSGAATPISSVLTAAGSGFDFPELVRDKYDFLGWSSDPAAAEGVSSLEPTGNSTYYAVWKKIVKRGDFNEDGEVNDDDAIYLLFSTFFEDYYPRNQDGDFNGDQKVTDEDAIYLLFHVFFPALYPL